MENLVLLGPGESVSNGIKKIFHLENMETLALHRVFPTAHTLYNHIPNYWTWADPDAATDGLLYLLKNHKQEPDLKKMKIVIPNYVCGTYEEFRKFAGTTPLGRDIALWEKYSVLLEQVKQFMNVDIFEAITTKNISTDPFNNLDYTADIHDTECFYRFTFPDKVVLGTVRYDSERVIATANKWGLENKVSSFMFPIAFYLRAKNVYCLGFDFVGARFFDKTKTRHAWGNNTARLNESIKFSLSLVDKWKSWSKIHGMSLYCAAPKSESLLSLSLSYKEIVADEKHR